MAQPVLHISTTWLPTQDLKDGSVSWPADVDGGNPMGAPKELQKTTNDYQERKRKSPLGMNLLIWLSNTTW